MCSSDLEMVGGLGLRPPPTSWQGLALPSTSCDISKNCTRDEPEDVDVRADPRLKAGDEQNNEGQRPVAVIG